MKPPQKLTPSQIAQILGDPAEHAGAVNIPPKNPVFFPGKLISLSDMSQMVTEKLLNTWVFFGREFQKMAERKDDPLRVVGKEDRERLVRALEALHWQCELTGLVNSMKICKDFLTEYNDVAWHWDAPRWQALSQGEPQPPMPKELPAITFYHVYSQFRLLYRILREEMSAVQLLVIRPDRAHLFEKGVS